MGAETVNTPERWRFWLDNGLGHVLGPLPWVDAARQAQACGAAEAAPGVFGRKNAAAAARIGRGNAAQAAVPSQKTDAGPASPSLEAKRPAGRKMPQTAAVAARGDNAAQAIAQDLVGSQRPMPSDAWPVAWREAWSKTGFARPFLWTYEHLGQDLLGTPDPGRRETLRQVLARLNLGPVHNFWPFSEPDGAGRLMLQPALFKEGVRHLAPKCLIFLGLREVEVITPPGAPELFKVISYFNSGVLCVYAPDIDELAANPVLLDDMAALFQYKLAHLI